jgi:hypothetical protein
MVKKSGSPASLFLVHTLRKLELIIHIYCHLIGSNGIKTHNNTHIIDKVQMEVNNNSANKNNWSNLNPLTPTSECNPAPQHGIRQSCQNLNWTIDQQIYTYNSGNTKKLNELDPINKGDKIINYINESTLHHCIHTDNESHETRALVRTGAQITLISK